MSGCVRSLRHRLTIALLAFDPRSEDETHRRN